VAKRKTKRQKPVAKDSRAVGRPSDYKPEYADQARKLCLLGATDKELAEFFNVVESTINLWKKEHPEFSESIKAGKDVADTLVVERLYARATGYEHGAVKIFGDPKLGTALKVPYTEKYPPDVNGSDLLAEESPAEELARPPRARAQWPSSPTGG
jgi:hypothetical protein